MQATWHTGCVYISIINKTQVLSKETASKHRQTMISWVLQFMKPSESVHGGYGSQKPWRKISSCANDEYQKGMRSCLHACIISACLLFLSRRISSQRDNSACDSKGIRGDHCCFIYTKLLLRPTTPSRLTVTPGKVTQVFSSVLPLMFLFVYCSDWTRRHLSLTVNRKLFEAFGLVCLCRCQNRRLFLQHFLLLNAKWVQVKGKA